MMKRLDVLAFIMRAKLDVNATHRISFSLSQAFRTLGGM